MRYATALLQEGKLLTGRAHVSLEQFVLCMRIRSTNDSVEFGNFLNIGKIWVFGRNRSWEKNSALGPKH